MFYPDSLKSYSARIRVQKKTIGREDSHPSGPRFDTVTPLRKAVGQLDKMTGMLHDPPRKPGLTLVVARFIHLILLTFSQFRPSSSIF